MRSALSLAQRALGNTAPNPAVGAVIVRDDKIVGQGFSLPAGRDHAEIVAIRNAKDLAKGATLYITLEPCCHTGRTPPCTEAIIKAGIKEVFISCKDPLQKGITALKKAGLTVKTGLYEDRSLEQNRGFFSRIKRKRPFVTCKIACSLDGGIGLKKGKKKWITSKKSRLDVHKLRASSDVILTGIGTVLADNLIILFLFFLYIINSVISIQYQFP